MSTEAMRKALERIKYEAVSLADAQVMALEALAAPQAQPEQAAQAQPQVGQGRDSEPRLQRTITRLQRQVSDLKASRNHFMKLAHSAAIDIVQPSREDVVAQDLIIAKRAALTKARAAGLSEDDIKALGIK